MGARVLIVDDAAFMRLYLKGILSRNGYIVVGEAQNGQVAFEKYQELRPDIVTMDITMPEVTGIEAVKHIKNFDRNAKVIMCSAMGQQQMVVEALKAGALDFIVKPFDESKVLLSIKKILGE